MRQLQAEARQAAPSSAALPEDLVARLVRMDLEMVAQVAPVFLPGQFLHARRILVMAATRVIRR